MKPPIRYRAGSRALAVLRAEGLRCERVLAVVGSASGPRWLALAGIDRALIDSGLGAAPREGPPRLLVGASAGAWRMMALACREPGAAHARLVRGYIHRVFPRNVQPAQVSAAYRTMLHEVFSADDVRSMLGGAATDLAIHVARLRGRLPWRAPLVQRALLGAATGLGKLRVPVAGWLAERVLAHARPDRLHTPFVGALVRLTAENLLPTALASGTIPIHMEPRSAPPGAPRGRYVDGGLTDYHLRQSYVRPGEGIVVFPHFQEKVEASWFSGDAHAAREQADALADVLQIVPSPGFFAALPGGRPPVTEDFVEFADAPDVRIARWSEVAARSERLGEALLRDLASGDWIARLEPIERLPLV